MAQATPKIDWAFLCDLAYFDGTQQLCMIGIDTRGPVRILPTGVYRFTIVARLLDDGLDELPDVHVAVAAPGGAPAVRSEMRAERRGEYLLVTIGSAPFLDEGEYRFEVRLGSRPAFHIPLVISTKEESWRHWH